VKVKTDKGAYYSDFSLLSFDNPYLFALTVKFWGKTATSIFVTEIIWSKLTLSVFPQPRRQRKHVHPKCRYKRT